MSGTGAGEDVRRVGRRLFWLLALLFALLAHGYVDNPDAETEFQSARALLRRGSMALSPSAPDASKAEQALVAAGHGVMRGRGGEYWSWFGPGHALAMTPFYAAGAGLAAAFPDVDREAYEERQASLRMPWKQAVGEEFWAHLVVSFHSPLFGAGIGLVLFTLLGHLGFGLRTRVAATLLACLATQLGPETRESMADTTAGFFLLWAIERGVRIVRGAGAAGARAGLCGRISAAPVTAGLIAGFAFACRPNHLLPLAALGLYLLVHGLRRGGRRPWLGYGYALGFAPFFVAMLGFNAWRFGSPFEFGYTAGTAEGYWNMNPVHGFLLLGLSPGKGVLWFTPLLWLAPIGLRRLGSEGRGERWLFASVLLLPWIVSSFMTGWHSSQAWGCRYLTPGAALLVAVASAGLLDALARQRRRVLESLFVGLCGLSLLWNLGGWATPYRGWFSLMLQPRAVEALFPATVRAGGDPAQALFASPRMTPLFGHLAYAWLSVQGEIPGRKPSLVYGMLAGSRGEEVEVPPIPAWPEDGNMRHFWWRGLAFRFDSGLPYALGGVMVVLLAFAGWSLARSVPRAEARGEGGDGP